MTKEVRRRSGTGAQHTTFTGAPAEVTVDTTDNRLVVHDGVTAGGHPVAKESELISSGGGLFKGENGEVGSAPGDIFRINKKTLAANVTIDADENASCTGPLEISDTYTLTIASGGVLAVL
jgi:hypothetical protein